MLKRVTLLCLLLLGSVWFARAQQPPEQINLALANLSGIVNQNLTLNDLQNWSFEQVQFPDTSLGCPQPGALYSQVVTLGFRFILTYNNVDYDYRVSADSRFTILCSSITTTQAAPQCPPPNEAGWLAPRLTPNGRGRVIPGGLPNNLRDVPGQSGALIGELQPGQAFTVLEGPSCTVLDRLIWWRVDANGAIGWTPEGVAPDYWLEPIDAAGNPLVTAAAPLANTLTILSPALLPSVQAISSAQGQESITDLSAVSTVQPLLAVTPADGSIQIINYADGTEILRISPFSAGVSALAFGASNLDARFFFAAGSSDGSLQAWEYSADGSFDDLPALIGTSSGITVLVFGEGGILAAGTEDSTVSLFNVMTGQLIHTLPAPTDAVGGPVRGITFTADALVITYSSGLAQALGVSGGNG
jgi:hypothetical protein